MQACGVLNEEQRIIGGSASYKYKYPWMAMLKQNNFMICGASLINDKYVLTTADCISE